METKKEREARMSQYNRQQTNRFRKRILGDQPTVKSDHGFVWTELAEKQNPARSVAGEYIWSQYLYEAPHDWLDKGIIIDKSEYDGKDGQVDLFDILEG